MGCWNETCMISHLPIKAGEDVVAFVIAYTNWKEGSNASGVCYSTDVASPFGLPIFGKYDDYGGVEDIDHNQLGARYLTHKFGKKPEGIQELLNTIARDNLTVVSPQTGKTAGAGQVMILRSIYDTLLADHRVTGFDLKYEPSLETIVEGFEAVRVRKERLKKLEMSQVKDVQERKEALRGVMDLIDIASMMGVHIDILERDSFNEMATFVMEANSTEMEQEFAELVIQMHKLRWSMGWLRRMWIGQAGTGSQNLGYRKHLVLIDAMKKHIMDSFDRPEDAYLTLLGKRDW